MREEQTVGERALPNQIPDQQTAAPVQQHARGLNKWGESLTQTDPFTKQSGETIRTASPADQSYTTLLASSLPVSQAGGINSKGRKSTPAPVSPNPAKTMHPGSGGDQIFGARLSIPFRFARIGRNIPYQFKKRNKTEQISSHFKSRSVPDFRLNSIRNIPVPFHMFRSALEKPLNQIESN
jgi:hypothetical protein